MQRVFIPILVERENKKELQRIDVTDLSITELSKLKETILKEGQYTDSVIILDRLIREKAEEITISSNISKKSYIRTYKENKKQEKIKKRGKYRRKIK